MPRGAPLQSPDLHAYLKALFQKYADVSVKLAPCASSNRNESLNQTFSTVAPKCLFYGGSESYDFRIACGIASHNQGQSFVSQVLTEAGMSPGKHTEAYSTRTDRIRTRERVRKSSIQYKRRRLELRSERNTKHANQEFREGINYRSGCALQDMVLDDEVIPEPIEEPGKEGVSGCDLIVVFDLETTGLGSDAQIGQLASCMLSKPDKNFSRFYHLAQSVPRLPL